MARESTAPSAGRKAVRRNVLARVFSFYYEGFRSMTVGRTLWLLIFIKLAIMFLVLKMFFFPNFLNTNFSSDAERSDHVLKELTKQK
ncbi:MAG: DUF4492 domain-containing protein [Bacteroidetes bacterium]|nr:MAG: DUF4492 domain-containing protein [Bacteroidota bacterium]